MFFFFFKQNTAYEIGTGDWSSDVCSSDLERRILRKEGRKGRKGREGKWKEGRKEGRKEGYSGRWVLRKAGRKIGRASCRERVEIAVVAVSLKKKREKNTRRE